ncbi:MAG TPA: superoxide dismutase [Gemmataceae bacterium]|nr:superoxide dismutase [Gemmataceae bacterium]
MAYTLPPLPYPADALEPHIDKTTMEIHHGRHHKAYVDNVNKALEGQASLQNLPIEQLLRQINQVPENIRQSVINNGGGHANHSMFWEIMGPKAGGKPSGPLGDDINKTFGDFAAFQQQIKTAAVGRFGSGWAWLVFENGKLQVLSTPNQDSPYMKGQSPILGVDVWEHAYYLKYQNKRPDYVDAWWNVVNWNAVGERYAKAKAGKL